MAFTSPDPSEMVRQHVKWAHIGTDPAMLPGDVDRALHVATSEPAGPTWLGLPQDLLETQAPASPRSRSLRNDGSPVRPTENAVNAAADLLASAERPVLVAGADVARRDAADAVVALAERLRAPLLEEGRRDFVASVVPTGHPLHGGRLDQAATTLEDADVVAYFGARMFTEFEAPNDPAPPPGARTIHLHSDPAEVGRLHAVDVALVGDPAPTLAALLDALSLRTVRATTQHTTHGPGSPPSTRPVPGHRDLAPVVTALADAVQAADATVVLDATTATGPLLGGLRTTRSGQVLGSTSGSLGWGMGASLGVACADPGRRVLCVIGDGAFQFGMPALWVARQLDAEVTFVVLNNGMYAAVASALGRFDGQAAAQDVWPGTDIRGLHIADAAAAFGVPSQRLRGTDESLAGALAQGMRTPGPALLEVLTAETVMTT